MTKNEERKQGKTKEGARNYTHPRLWISRSPLPLLDPGFLDISLLFFSISFLQRDSQPGIVSSGRTEKTKKKKQDGSEKDQELQLLSELEEWRQHLKDPSRHIAILIASNSCFVNDIVPRTGLDPGSLTSTTQRERVSCRVCACVWRRHQKTTRRLSDRSKD